MTTIKEPINTSKATNNKSLQHGEFKLQIKTTDNQKSEIVIKPLKADELADGWRVQLPRRTTNSETYHFSYTLDKLPPYLWKKIRDDVNDKDNYAMIHDNIYEYIIKKTPQDDELFELYELLNQFNPDIERVKDLFDILQKASIKEKESWIMIKAHKMIKENNQANKANK